jgi:hypothetical protein
MTWLYVLGGITSLGLLIYLVIASGVASTSTSVQLRPPTKFPVSRGCAVLPPPPWIASWPDILKASNGGS